MTPVAIEMGEKFYVIQLMQDYDFYLNKRKYYKGERVIVWDFDKESYCIANSGGEYLKKEYCKVLYDVKFYKTEQGGKTNG